jgi:hypothetical protein
MNKQPTDIVQDEPDLQGEGNVEAARRFNQAEKAFVKSGKVRKAAAKAAPRDAAEAEELQRAEAVGRAHAKEEDPAVQRPPPVESK